ncbi:MAG: 16S rRNA (guanine(527)-N(7))-methyltransferase RsmG [Gammaproteobacteria bacterium]|jgi:16S rRNA (guanine527-N7)-methyltransferase|nr:16S rRNA (guanine(527)-N(7))-methyltransferase RsmG [Gammaproteobacteria bacterium]
MNSGPTQRQALQKGAQQLQISLQPKQLEQLLAYLALLIKWNRAYNLTAVRDPDEMVSRHLLDSLSVLPHVELGGKRWLDVGSGGGMPGIILAIMLPERAFSLLDSNGKKTRFLTQVKLELKLDNVQVFHQRIEEHRVDVAYDGIISRAFSSLPDFAAWTAHVGNSDTRWLAMKGVEPEDELQQLVDGFAVRECHKLFVPGCQGQRHLLVLNKVNGEH